MKTEAEVNLPYEAMFRLATGFATPPFDYQRRLAEHGPFRLAWYAGTPAGSASATRMITSLNSLPNTS